MFFKVAQTKWLTDKYSEENFLTRFNRSIVLQDKVLNNVKPTRLLRYTYS